MHPDDLKSEDPAAAVADETTAVAEAVAEKETESKVETPSDKEESSDGGDDE